MSDPTPIPSGEIQLFDGFEPGLKDATYRVDVVQTVSAADAYVPPAAQTFRVDGPRFTIDPADIHTVFPPDGATGAFSEVLPHIVLNKRLLPWERDVPGLAGDVPWVALLAFEDGELLAAPAGGQGVQTCTVQQLLAADPTTRKPALKAVTDDELARKCRTITVASATFARLVATARELPYLAHARRVNTGDKPMFGHKDDGWFSVVVANRFPRPGTTTAAARTTVHLVSLEGFGDLLTGDAPVAPAEAQVQLVSLASWTFSCLADPAQTFAGLARALAFDANGAPRPGDSLLLRLPVAPTGPVDPIAARVRQRLADGYVALGYHAPTGEDGFAWYRGPFTPVVPAAVPSGGGFATSDAAMIFDPNTGVFDHSLATAWQIGRCLALASQPFAEALMRVRRQAGAALERLAAPARVPASDRLAAVFAAGALSLIHEASTSGRLGVRARTATARLAPVTALRSALARPHVQAELAAQLDGSTDADIVTAWLGQLLLLRGVPFVHLVPDARMLPPGSLRFFYVDPGWQGALVDGALSVGIGTSRDAEVQAPLTQKLKQGAQAAALAWRAGQLGQPTPSPAHGPTAGFLLRSGLASGWPGLAVVGAAHGARVPILRLDHLGAGVLLCLFDGVPDTVTLTEPQEGLEFGVDDDGQVETRTLAPPEVHTGKPVTVYDPRHPDAPSVAVRPGNARVLNVRSGPATTSGPPTDPKDLVEALARALGQDPASLGPAAFALQMIKGPEQLVFAVASTLRAAS
ncbi:hypothetical protein [Sorangium sp. So ce204]|uniref:hypothetical protein n=1 Tax=Sorangium sp. So ce204 TaxID=3133288 RepID=UPI003F6475D3